MRRPVAMVALARPAANLFALLMLAMPAQAADRALLNMLGYSADGSKFAFEEFGVQDGSGFAFSSIYVVDLVNDKWTYGTPFEVVADVEETSLGAVRAEAMDKAHDKLDEYGIGVPVQVLMMIGDGVANDRANRAHWSTPSCCGPGQVQADAFDLTLEMRGIGSDEPYCQDMSAVGFNLYYQDETGRRPLHLDGDKLPKSRGCTLDYGIYAVVQPFSEIYTEGFTARRVAIIASYPFGFEGVDRRFLAVPIDR